MGTHRCDVLAHTRAGMSKREKEMGGGKGVYSLQRNVRFARTDICVRHQEGAPLCTGSRRLCGKWY